jgi:hypothetical protein
MLASSNSKSLNKITGEWKPDKMEESENASTFTYKMTNDTWHMSSPSGSLEAKLDGTDAPFTGDPGLMLSVKKLDAAHIEMVSKRDGKVVGIGHLSADPDGKHLKWHYEDKLNGTTLNAVGEKQ